MLSLIAVAGYFFSAMNLQSTAYYSPSFGITTPQYLLGNISPFVILLFQLGTLFLLFDSSHRNKTELFEEVLNTKPLSNFEYLLGRVMGVSAILWIVTFLLVIGLHGFGLLCEVAGFRVAESFQIHSVLNLLIVDAPVSYIGWSSLVVLITSLMRVRFGVLIVGATLMTAWALLVSKLPYSILSITSTSSNDTLFVSELLPQFASITSVGTRIATLIFAFALLLFAASSGRGDGVSAESKVSIGGLVIALSGFLYGLTAWGMVQTYYEEPTKWKEAHESYSMEGAIDISKISGTVRIDPTASLLVDLEISFESNARTKFIFTFNPAMKIDELKLNGTPATYTFENGLLELKNDDTNDLSTLHTMHIVAMGIPDPRFGYFDSAIDYLTDRSVPVSAVSLLGKDGSIYDRNYVALMSGVCWYPTSGSLGNAVGNGRREKDFFEVDLKAELVATNWQLVGPGTSPVTTTERNRLYHVNPERVVTEINLFASEFENVSKTVGGWDISLYLHKRHTPEFSFWSDELLGELDEFVDSLRPELAVHGLSLPSDRLSIVETPDRLRRVGGGWRMKSLTSLPQITLLRESGYPKINAEIAFSRRVPKESVLDEGVWDYMLFGHLKEYFLHALATDNPFLGYAERLWFDDTAATDEFAYILDEIVLSLISPTSMPFSVYSTFHVAEVTHQMVPAILSSRFGFVVRARNQEHYFGTRIEVWNRLESTHLSTLTIAQDHQESLELALLKARNIAEGIRSVNDVEKIATWLTDIRREFAGRSYTKEDMIAKAKHHSVEIEPFLTSWLREPNLPGYSLSPLTVVRVADDEAGEPQYQASIFVHNTQPIDGMIQLRYPKEKWAAALNWTEWMETSGVLIPANSSKRLNIITHYELRQVQFVPGFSLNRDPFVVHADANAELKWQNTPSRPFVEASNWYPKASEKLVVDDLDEGFSVSQPIKDQRQYIAVGPLRWFNQNSLWAFEVDGGLPVHRGSVLQMRREVWSRRSNNGGYGRHRKTSTMVWLPRSTTPSTVSFETELPTSTTWQLEYHLPVEWVQNYFSKLVYQFQLHNSGDVKQIEFDTKGNGVGKGWNLVGQFELDAGPVKVDVLGSTTPGLLFADAIRWSKVVAE